MEFAAKAIYVFDTVGHVFTIFPHAGEGRIANGAQPPCRRFYGTYTSTTVPSLIGTSRRGLKTPFSYFAGMVILFYSILRGEPLVPGVS